MYDALTWRTLTHDPNAVEYAHQSPYSWTGNNPILNIDPDGRDWFSFTDEDGEQHVEWRDSEESTIDIDGNAYENIGAFYAKENKDGGIDIYNQNEVFATIGADDIPDVETIALIGHLMDPGGQHNFNTMTPQWEMLFFSSDVALMIGGASAYPRMSGRTTGKDKRQFKALNDLQKKNINRFLKKAPANSSRPQYKKLGNGNVQVSVESPGKVPGSKAIYIKEIDSTGTTVKMYKITRDPQGGLVHNKNKFNNRKK